MKMTRLRHLAQVNPSSPAFETLDEDAELTFLPMEAVWPGERLDITRRRSKREVAVGYTRFQDGDLLVPKITPTFEAGRAILVRGLIGGVGAGTTELHVVRAGSRVDPRFLYYVVNAHSFLRLGEAEMYGVAGQQRVPDSFLRDFPVFLPGLEDQARIVQFLDAETRRMSELGWKLSRFRVNLEERDHALLGDLLNHRVEQPGESLPEGWEWVPLAHLTDPFRQIMYGIVLPGPNVADGVPVVKGGDVAAGRLSADSLNRTSYEIESRYERSRLAGGDLVIAIRGSVGEVAVVPNELGGANLTQDAARISVSNSVDKRWLRLVLGSPVVAHEIQRRVTGATIKGINIWDLKRIPVPVPPRQTQSELAEEVGREIGLHDALRERVSRHELLLAERRQALITAAVTGQFDVSTASGRNVTDVTDGVTRV